ncbi:hypothetical protein JXK06_01690 [Patescibacteria group bacterium]|nr:hypothetical protein [Patescibacteria group bacterium]
MLRSIRKKIKLNFNQLIIFQLRAKKEAFSLIEIVIILFVISLGLIGILSLIIQNIQSQDYNKNNLIATQLSQEGIELIRRVRDSNFKQGFDFNFGLAENQDEVFNYCFDYNDSAPTPTSLACSLRFDGDGFYVHDSVGISSGFSRLIKVELVDDEDSLAVGVALKVISEVSWASRGGISSYTTETLLYDWYQDAN